MSPSLITGLILGGLFLLIAIGYINHIVERSKLEKARLRADLGDRIRRCATLSDALPGQMMSGPLKLALSRLELQLCEQLQPIDRQNALLRQRIETLRAEVAKGDAIEVGNAPQSISSEAKAKEVRFQLEDLSAQMTHAAKQGLMDTVEAKRWLRECQRLAVMLNIEFLSNTGKIALERQQPRQARLAFERAVQFIRKQPQPAPFDAQLKRLEAQLEQANAMVLQHNTPQQNEPSELNEGLDGLDDDDLWKKKNIYE